MDALVEVLAKSGANIGLIAYSIFVTIMWTLSDRERRNHVQTIFQLQKDFSEALDPIGKIISQCYTMLEILTRGRR